MSDAHTMEGMPTRWLRAMEEWEARRLGSKPRARAAIAQMIDRPESSLERIRRGRVKDPRSSLVLRIRRVFVALLTREILELEHDLAVALQSDCGLDAAQAREAQAALEQARRLIGG